jgi:hypothetical protein
MRRAKVDAPPVDADQDHIVRALVVLDYFARDPADHPVQILRVHKSCFFRKLSHIFSSFVVLKKMEPPLTGSSMQIVNFFAEREAKTPAVTDISSYDSHASRPSRTLCLKL